jgi:hypothetical protein
MIVLNISAGFAVTLSILASIITFFVAFSISNFFIAPRENWRQSAFHVILLKLGIAGGAAFWAFVLVSGYFLR